MQMIMAPEHSFATVLYNVYRTTVQDERQHNIPYPVLCSVPQSLNLEFVLLVVVYAGLLFKTYYSTVARGSNHGIPQKQAPEQL